MLAAQIQNLPPQPIPPTPVQVAAAPKKKRTGGGDWPESNLYDPIEGDWKHPFFDADAAVENIAQLELVQLEIYAKQLTNILADIVSVETNPLKTEIVVQSSEVKIECQAKTVGVDSEQLTNSVSSATSDITIKVADTDISVDTGNDDK